MSDTPERKWRTIRDLGVGPVAEDPVVLSEAEEDLAETPEFSGQSADGVDPGEVEQIPIPSGPQRVLVAYPAAATRRLVRETLENFTDSIVETTSDPVRAFEMALQKPYRIFLFALDFGEMNGSILYELICKVYSTGHGPKKLAPGVIFIRESKEVAVSEEMVRDARVKDIVSKPIRIDRLLRSVDGILEIYDPTSTGEG